MEISSLDFTSKADVPSSLFTSRELEQIEILAISNYQLAESGEIPMEAISPALYKIANSYETYGPGVWRLPSEYAEGFITELTSYRETARMVYLEKSGFDIEDRLHAEDCVNIISSILRKLVVRLV